MPIHPIAVVDQILAEYRSYLLTEFRASDATLRQALSQALDRPGFLAQEPFFQAHRPFKEGKPWAQLGLDGKLAKVMEARSGSKTAFLHQSDAIEHLLSKEATPLVVTTGTGSGKTECFLLPAIQNAIEDAIRFKHPGLTRPFSLMNALANDQEARIREYLEASGHTYVKVEPHIASERVREERYLSDAVRKKAGRVGAGTAAGRPCGERQLSRHAFQPRLGGHPVRRTRAHRGNRRGPRPFAAAARPRCRAACVPLPLSARRNEAAARLRSPDAPIPPAESRMSGVVSGADWERTLKRPVGYPWNPRKGEHGEPIARMDENLLPDGTSRLNAWRAGSGGMVPRIQRVFVGLLQRMGGAAASEALLLETLKMLVGGGLLDARDGH